MKCQTCTDVDASIHLCNNCDIRRFTDRHWSVALTVAENMMKRALAERDAEMLRLYDKEKMTVKQVAAQIGISSGIIRQRMAKLGRHVYNYRQTVDASPEAKKRRSDAAKKGYKTR